MSVIRQWQPEKLRYGQFTSEIGTQKEKVRLNTFGETRYKSQDCDIVNLRLKKPGCDDSVIVGALSYPAICSPLPSKINFGCPHLEGLELADDC